MNEIQILDQCVEIIKEFAEIDENELNNLSKETYIVSDLGVNSARIIDIILKIEDVFDIELDDDEASSMETIGDAVNIISNKLSADRQKVDVAYS